MSNLQGNGQKNEFKTRMLPGGRVSSYWIAAGFVVITVLLGLAYMSQNVWMTPSDTAEQKAAAEAPPGPLASPINPAPSASSSAPAATPKP